MGTDWVTLFDLDAAKAVLRLDAPGLTRFLAERGRGFAERDQLLARERNAQLAATLPRMAEAFGRFLYGLGLGVTERAPERGRAQGPPADTLSEFEKQDIERAAALWDGFAERLHGGEELGSLRVEVAWASGTLSNNLAIDYWGCFAEVLMDLDVERTCDTNLVLEPGDLDGTHVYFLLAPQVDAMIASLRAHWSEVRVMNETGLRRLVEYRNRCASDPGVRVAYHIDF